MAIPRNAKDKALADVREANTVSEKARAKFEEERNVANAVTEYLTEIFRRVDPSGDGRGSRELQHPTTNVATRVELKCGSVCLQGNVTPLGFAADPNADGGGAVVRRLVAQIRCGRRLAVAQRSPERRRATGTSSCRTRLPPRR